MKLFLFLDDMMIYLKYIIYGIRIYLELKDIVEILEDIKFNSFFVY